MTTKGELAMPAALDSAHMHLPPPSPPPRRTLLRLWLCMWPHHSLPCNTAVWSAPGTTTRKVSSVLGETLCPVGCISGQAFPFLYHELLGWWNATVQQLPYQSSSGQPGMGEGHARGPFIHPIEKEQNLSSAPS